MDLKNLGSALLKFSPVIAGAIGGPAGNMVANLLASFFGVETDILPKTIAEDPNAEFKLKQFELQHEEELKKIGSTDYATEVDDRKDARKNSTEFKDFLRHFAYLVTSGFFAALFLLFVPGVNMVLDSDEKQLLAMLVGVLVSKWQTIIDFFYGSSNRH